MTLKILIVVSPLPTPLVEEIKVCNHKILHLIGN